MREIKVTCGLLRSAPVNHQKCHIAAKAAARAYLRSNEDLSRLVKQMRANARIEQTLRRRDRLTTELKQINELLKKWSIVLPAE